jgi:hypothetical protein
LEFVRACWHHGKTGPGFFLESFTPALSFSVRPVSVHSAGWNTMLAPTDVLNKKRELLRIKRDLLFNKFIDHPNDFRFALEIKTMDDEIADYTCRIEREMRRAS